MSIEGYAEIEPVYEELPGWRESTVGITDHGALPAAARAYLERLAELVSVPDRHDLHRARPRADHRAAASLRRLTLGTPAGARSARRRRGWRSCSSSSLACLAAAGSWRIYSATWDEPEHLAAGIQLLDRGCTSTTPSIRRSGRRVPGLRPVPCRCALLWHAAAGRHAEGKDILYGADHYGCTWCSPAPACCRSSSCCCSPPGCGHGTCCHTGRRSARGGDTRQRPADPGHTRGSRRLISQPPRPCCLPCTRSSSGCSSGRPRDALLFGLARRHRGGHQVLGGAVPRSVAAGRWRALHCSTARAGPGAEGVTAGALAGRACLSVSPQRW